MKEIVTARYRARIRHRADAAGALGLRAAQFRRGAPDEDRFDANALHLELMKGDQVIGAARAILHAAPMDVSLSYAAQYYDLEQFSKIATPSVEFGRLALTTADPEALRLMFGLLAHLALTHQAGWIFGCTSFFGAKLETHGPALSALTPHIGPSTLAPNVLKGHDFPKVTPDVSAWPGLLRFYLGLGGWVGAGVHLDHDLDTAHIFTALDLGRLSPARRAALARLAG